MYKFIPLLLASMFLVSSLQAKKAVVSFVVGKVWQKAKPGKKAKYRRVRLGDKIKENATIVTGNASYVTLVYNKSEFKLMPKTTFHMQSLPTNKKAGKVKIKKGFGWFKIRNAKKGFNASTVTSTAGVRGTAFATIYDKKNKKAFNCICHGKVEVGNLQKKKILFTAGNGSMIKRGTSKIVKTKYSDHIKKKHALVSFKKKIQADPILQNCLSCHTPKGWKWKGVPRDNTYGK
ncbi:MAG: FecR domain-containing protein [Spirochaetota bacterium]